jgi:transcriptional regulator with XRE-family HTH domain
VPSPDNPLLIVFADRLNQVIDRRPDVCRKGRGRVGDFAERFGLHYTTAHRLLNGASLPTAQLLLEIGKAFDVSLDWLMGIGREDVDQQLEDQPLSIEVFDPRSNRVDVIWLPLNLLPVGLDSSKLLAAVVTTGLMGGSYKELALVRVMPEIADGAVHLVYDPAKDRNVLLRLYLNLSQNKITAMANPSGMVETIDADSVVFGQTHGAKSLSIVGPVIGSLSFQPVAPDRP